MSENKRRFKFLLNYNTPRIYLTDIFTQAIKFIALKFFKKILATLYLFTNKN